MVSVVVDDEDAARLAAHLEAPLGAAELAQARRDALERHAELQADRDGGERVQQVVAPGTFSSSRPSVANVLAGSSERRARRFTVAVTDIGPRTTSVAVMSADSESCP